MSGWGLLLVIGLAAGVGFLLVDVRGTTHADDVNFGRLGRGVLVVIIAVLTLGSAAYVLHRLVLYDASECEWDLRPLGASCESLGPSDPTKDPTGSFPTAALIGITVSITALTCWSKRRLRPREGT